MSEERMRSAVAWSRLAGAGTAVLANIAGFLAAPVGESLFDSVIGALGMVLLVPFLTFVAGLLMVTRDPRTTMRYDRARNNLDRHPNYTLAATWPPAPELTHLPR